MSLDDPDGRVEHVLTRDHYLGQHHHEDYETVREHHLESLYAERAVLVAEVESIDRMIARADKPLELDDTERPTPDPRMFPSMGTDAVEGAWPRRAS